MKDSGLTVVGVAGAVVGVGAGAADDDEIDGDACLVSAWHAAQHDQRDDGRPTAHPCIVAEVPCAGGLADRDMRLARDTRGDRRSRRAVR